MAQCAAAQVAFQTQNSETTADLRGIHAVNASVAWASGTHGTVLRTVDGGAHWMKCAVPPDGKKLDFRGVWAWDEKEAMILASGPGDRSRVYHTQDGCSQWHLSAEAEDGTAFWDALVFLTPELGGTPNDHLGLVLGDPVEGRFWVAGIVADDRLRPDQFACRAQMGDGAFAASNTSLVVFPKGGYVFGAGGTNGAKVFLSPLLANQKAASECLAVPVPLAGGTESAGVFSLGFRDREHGIAVGGDYKKPNESAGTAAFTSDGGLHWTAATKLPHGYRSAVAWDAKRKFWIAVGTNGSDISRDDGKTWERVEDGNWNAISVPFVVGPGGRIAKLAPVYPVSR